MKQICPAVFLVRRLPWSGREMYLAVVVFPQQGVWDFSTLIGSQSLKDFTFLISSLLQVMFVFVYRIVQIGFYLSSVELPLPSVKVPVIQVWLEKTISLLLPREGEWIYKGLLIQWGHIPHAMNSTWDFMWIDLRAWVLQKDGGHITNVRVEKLKQQDNQCVKRWVYVSKTSSSTES